MCLYVLLSTTATLKCPKSNILFLPRLCYVCDSDMDKIKWTDRPEDFIIFLRHYPKGIFEILLVLESRAYSQAAQHLFGGCEF